MTTATKIKPATEKQIFWIEKKIAEFRGVEALRPMMEAISEGMAEQKIAYGFLSAGYASTILDTLFALKAPKPQAAEVAEVPEGLHLLDGQIRKVRVSKAGNRYAEILIPAADVKKKGSWEYAGMKGLQGLSAGTVLTLEKAKAFGLAFGFCSCCGAHLSDPKSVEAGIGPVCATKF